jgi:hypothetical protein
MDNESTSTGAADALAQQAAAIGRLAEDAGAFHAAAEAYGAEDRDAFRWVLGQRGLVERCELLCCWWCAKWCVLTCLELCGPPDLEAKEPPDSRRLAEVVGRVVADEKLLQRVVEGVASRDADDFREVAAQLEIGDLCHFFCHWVCTVICRRRCVILCSQTRPDVLGAVEAVRSAGELVVKLGADREAYAAAAVAADALDCDPLRSAITVAGLTGGCEEICLWFCSWRCVLVCLLLTRAFPVVEIASPVEEMLEFARATARLSGEPAALGELATAVRERDAERFGRVVAGFQMERFAVQLCQWACCVVCGELCFCVCPPASVAFFVKIGGYYYDNPVLPNIDAGLGGTGLTSDGRAFFQTLRLNGGYSLTDGAPQIEYRFETVPTDAAGNPTGAWQAVVPAQIAETTIGYFYTPPFTFKPLIVNGPVSPNSYVATISVDGWVQVPQRFSPLGQFIPTEDLIRLESTTLAPFPHADETGVVAGGPANTPLVQDAHFGIRMRVRNVGDPGSEYGAGTCHHIAVDNTLYDNITRHPEWDGGLQPPGQLCVSMVDVQELIAGGGCNDLHSTLDVLFTAAHPNLDTAGVSVRMDGPGGPYAFDIPAIARVAQNWHGTADPSGWTFASLKPCAYLVTLSVNVLLTDGDNVPDPVYDQIAFCKS